MKDYEVKISYFGASVFKITTDKGKKILIDPYITQNPLCRENLEYFYDVDLLLVSHGTYDHLGNTIEIMKNSKATLICGTDVEKYCLEMGIPRERVRRTGYGGERESEGIKVRAVYAAHSSKIESGTETYYGMPMGFIVTTENGIRIYHTGDTALFGDLKLIGMLYRPNILLIGISGVSEGHTGDMHPNEAALATLWVAPNVVMPMHYLPGSDAVLKFHEAIKVTSPNVEAITIEPNSQVTYSRYQLKVG